MGYICRYNNNTDESNRRNYKLTPIQIEGHSVTQTYQIINNAVKDRVDLFKKEPIDVFMVEEHQLITLQFALSIVGRAWFRYKAIHCMFCRTDSQEDNTWDPLFTKY